MGKAGNIGNVVYVTNGNSVYSSIAFTGRGKNEPPGTKRPPAEGAGATAECIAAAGNASADVFAPLCR